MAPSFKRTEVAGPSLTGTRCSACGALAVSREARLLALFERAHVCLGLSRGALLRRKIAHSVALAEERGDPAARRTG